MRHEDVDVSSNVFFPPGISLQPGQFIVKLYTGEDFPQSKQLIFRLFVDIVDHVSPLRKVANIDRRSSSSTLLNVD